MTAFALLAHGTRGDVEPFIALGRLLSGCGDSVTVLTHAPYEAQVRSAGCDFIAVDGTEAYDLHLRRAEALVESRPVEGMSGYYTDRSLFYDRVSVAGGAEQLHREVLALTGLATESGERLVIIGRHTSSISGLIAAELTGAPVALVALSPTQLITAAVAGLHLARAAAGEINALRGRFGLPAVTRWGRWLCAAGFVAGLWPEWFDAAGTASPQPLELTDFPLADTTADGTDLTESTDAAARLVEGAVVITGGSGRMLNPDFYPVAVAGAALSGRRAVVVTPHADLLPSPLPDGVVHVERLPFAAVMPQAAAVVHHGGIGTLARALAAGVPQLLLAHGGDRPDNGRRLEQLGLAKSWTADAWSADVLARALDEIGDAAERGSAPPAPAGTGVAVLADRIQSWIAGLEDSSRPAPVAAR